MFGFLKKLFGGKPAEVKAEAPYKVETPAQAPVVEVKAETAPAPAEAKPAAKKKAPAKKPAAPKTAAPKRGRKPKAK